MYFVDNPQLILQIITDLHDHHGLKPGKALLVGISSGGSAALAIAAQQPQQYLGVVATPGRIWDESRIQSLKDLPIYLRIGERDSFRWNSRLEQTVELLHAAGANVDAAIIPNAKHIFPLDWENLESWLDTVQQPAH
jgi:predicted esterase